MKDTTLNLEKTVECIECIKWFREQCGILEPNDKLDLGYQYQEYWDLLSYFYYGCEDETREIDQEYDEQMFYEFEKIMDKWNVIFVESSYDTLGHFKNNKWSY